MLEIKSSEQNGMMVLLVGGRLDAVTAPEFQQECEKIMDGGCVKIVADMAGLEYISSAGLRSILASAKKLKAAQGELRFSGLEGMVAEVFSMSGFTSMFPIFTTVDEAVAG